MWDDKGSSARRQKHCQQKTKKTFHDTLSMLGGFVQIALLELRRRLEQIPVNFTHSQRA